MKHALTTSAIMCKNKICTPYKHSVTFTPEYTRQRSSDCVGVPRLPPSTPRTSKRSGKSVCESEKESERARARERTARKKNGEEDGKPQCETKGEEACVPGVHGQHVVHNVGELVCVPCSECTEQALLVRDHLSYDRSVPTLPARLSARLPASCLPPAYLPPGSADCPLLHPSTFTAAILSLAEPVGFSSLRWIHTDSWTTLPR